MSKKLEDRVERLAFKLSKANNRIDAMQEQIDVMQSKTESLDELFDNLDDKVESINNDYINVESFNESVEAIYEQIALLWRRLLDFKSNKKCICNSMKQVNDSYDDYKDRCDVDKAFEKWAESPQSQFCKDSLHAAKQFAVYFAERVKGGKL